MRRPAPFGRAIPATFLVAFLLTACAPQAAPPSTGNPSSTVPCATATATGTATAAPGATATAPGSAPWRVHTTADGQLAFDLPAAWSVREPAGELPAGGGVFAEVTNQAGKPLASLRTNLATGSTCMERHPYSVLESQELPALAHNGTAPRYIFETRGNDAAPGPADTPAAAYGMKTSALPTGDSACAIFQFFTWPPTAAICGAFYSPENNVTPGADSLPYLVRTPERNLGSPRARVHLARGASHQGNARRRPRGVRTDSNERGTRRSGWRQLASGVRLGGFGDVLGHGPGSEELEGFLGGAARSGRVDRQRMPGVLFQPEYLVVQL
ncbi:hypothetical protein ABIB45_001944 [Arthrobacter sp. UYCo732]